MWLKTGTRMNFQKIVCGIGATCFSFELIVCSTTQCPPQNENIAAIVKSIEEPSANPHAPHSEVRSGIDEGATEISREVRITKTVGIERGVVWNTLQTQGNQATMLWNTHDNGKRS
jgi:hypothetical protein